MISEFIYKYYIDPIRYGEAYTWVDTLTYALILIICLLLISRLFSKFKILLDRNFAYALIPWIVFGGFLRVVEDTGAVPALWSPFLTTPLVFFMIFGYGLIILIITGLLKRYQYIQNPTKIFNFAGIVSAALTLIFLVIFGFMNARFEIIIALTIMGMAIFSTFSLYAILRYALNWRYLKDRLYQILIFSHMLDASATSYGIDIHEIPYLEQHVVGSTLIDITGTAFVMFPLKLLVIIPGIYVLEAYKQDKASSLWYLILMAMIMVGLAPGIRDMMRMVLYV